MAQRESRCVVVNDVFYQVRWVISGRVKFGRGKEHGSGAVQERSGGAPEQLGSSPEAASRECRCVAVNDVF